MNAVCGHCTVVGTQLNHDETCPLGRALDETMWADRQWFEDHPWTGQRRRPVTWAERSRMGNEAGDSRVLVTLISRGVRSRRFGNVEVIDIDDDVLALIGGAQ